MQHPFRKVLNAVFSLALTGAVLVSCKRPFPTAPDREAIMQTRQAFHSALQQDDRKAAMALLAPDAAILEMGVRETRAEYEAQHLAADAEFARTVSVTQGVTIVRQEGDVAWASTTNHCQGTFRGKEVDNESTELMVLAKDKGKWQIRAIHWSGSPHRP